MTDREQLQATAELEVARRIREMAERLIAESPEPLELPRAIDLVVVGLRSMGSVVADRIIRAAETQAAAQPPAGPNRAQRRAARRRHG